MSRVQTSGSRGQGMYLRPSFLQGTSICENSSFSTFKFLRARVMLVTQTRGPVTSVLPQRVNSGATRVHGDPPLYTTGSCLCLRVQNILNHLNIRHTVLYKDVLWCFTKNKKLIKSKYSFMLGTNTVVCLEVLDSSSGGSESGRKSYWSRAVLVGFCFRASEWRK